MKLVRVKPTLLVCVCAFSKSKFYNWSERGSKICFRLCSVCCFDCSYTPWFVSPVRTLPSSFFASLLCFSTSFLLTFLSRFTLVVLYPYLEDENPAIRLLSLDVLTSYINNLFTNILYWKMLHGRNCHICIIINRLTGQRTNLFEKSQEKHYRNR